MVDEEYSATRNLSTFLGGLAIGYGLALLFAPRSGRETRQMITEYAQSAGENLAAKARSAVSSARQTAESAQRKASEYIEEGKEKIRGQVRAAADEVEQRVRPRNPENPMRP